MYRLAEQKFAAAAEKFLKDCSLQFGVHIFMMAGYKDQNGKMLRTKYATLFYLTCIADAFCTRMESPKLHTDAKMFLPIFQQVGGESWMAYDQFLKDCAGELFIILHLSW